MEGVQSTSAGAGAGASAGAGAGDGDATPDDAVAGTPGASPRSGNITRWATAEPGTVSGAQTDPAAARGTAAPGTAAPGTAAPGSGARPARRRARR